jgi:tRNA modification GTPase
VPTADPTDTIVATSSPPGRSFRAIVRLSGPEARALGASVFASDPPLGRIATYRSVPGHVVLKRDRIRCPADAYVMLAPRSYTREDVVEFHTVGAPPLLSALVDALTAAGARPAEPGEFTRRAFLNGRIDLTQAEAVQAVIRARSEAELRVAQAQLGGAFRRTVEGLRVALVDLLAEIEASIDFVDQDIEIIGLDEVARRLADLLDRVERLTGSEPPAPPKEGVVAALYGLPNAGKSSLLNALAGRDRAIVMHVPGTTRDTLEHVVDIDGISFRLVDTAGLRAGGGAIEDEAMNRAGAAAAAADLALLVVDGSAPLDDADRERWWRRTGQGGPPTLTVLSKADLPRRVSAAGRGRLARRGPVVCVSARTGQGLDELRAAMIAAARSDPRARAAHAFWVGSRHRAALGRAAAVLQRARRASAGGLGAEFVAADLHEALAALGEIVGRSTPDDVLDAIFSRFCVGK